MSQAPLASRLATRFWAPAAVVAAISGLLVAADFFRLVPDRLAGYAAVAVAVPLAALFLIATFDPRCQKAVTAVNAEIRARRADGRPWRNLEFDGVPAPRLRALKLLIWALMVELFLSWFFDRDGAEALVAAAFALVVMFVIAIVAGAFPTDEYKSAF